MRLAAGLLLFAFTLAACAPVRWQKADGDASTLAPDLQACRKLAQERSARMGYIGMAPSNDPRFGPTGPSQADQLMQEKQAEFFCMRDKGYALVPDEK